MSSTRQSALGAALRVGVSMEKGEQTVTSMDMRAALARLRRSAPVYSTQGWDVFAADDLGFGVCYTDHATKRIVVDKETWELLGFEPQGKYALLEQLRAGASGAKILPRSEGLLLDALRVKARMSHANGPVALVIDPLSELHARAQKIMLEAASVNETDDPLQREIFLTRYAQLEEDWRDLEEKVARIRDAIEMAGDAVARN